jgi:hypothetical protein
LIFSSPYLSVSASKRVKMSLSRERLVVRIEYAARLVQHLHDAYQRVLVVDQRQREHAARAVPGRTVHGRIEARIRVAVGHVDDPALARAGADQPRARPHAHRRDAGRDEQDELVGRRLEQPHRAAVRVQHLLRRVDDLAQHRRQVERRRERARDAEDRLEILRREPAPTVGRVHGAPM